MTTEHIILTAMEELAREELSPEEPGNYYTLVFVLGDPPTYEDRIPDEWSDCAGTVIDEFGDQYLVRFQPRWATIDERRINLHDGLAGMYGEAGESPNYQEDYENKVVHHIEPTEYSVALVARNVADPEVGFDTESLSGDWEVDE